ncbi:dynein regulatory complex subunit 3-like [Styela clava]|uniref:dynein regulatory complex subunit 3-like n=1 Tax=Styela clava TaxID=7725 RepID=UPI0019399256|nr:dynein regulatory complex subunit 3-like [Styela clava]
MSRLYDTVEPAVIDDEMLRKAVEEQGPKEEAGRIAKQEGIDYKDVLSLRLDFRNILKIDNLWQFTKLTKLQLDDNIIEKIEGLDQLVNLVWLDLSFNNIEVLEGLSKLTKLEDLTLYSNRISRLENMDSLKNLHVLSVGNNKLNQLDNLIYLRRFTNLRTLNLSGCPVCDDPGYRLFTVAYLSHLVYLDFRLIDEDTRNKAHNLYENKLGELMHNEKQKEKELERKKEEEQELQNEKDAYVEYLNGSFLFDSLYTEDPEGQKLATLPGLEEMLQDFKDKFIDVCHKIYEYGMKEHGRRTHEVDEFMQCVADAKVENKKLGTTDIDKFEQYKRKVFAELVVTSDATILESKISEYHETVNKLWDTLMAFEMQLVDQLEETIKDFERNLADMMTSFVEYVQGLISQIRELENNHNEKLLEMSMVILEKVVKNEMEEELPEDIRMLFVDKETIVNAIGASHDVHLLKIDNREDDIVTRSGAWLTALIAKIHAEETTRNRKRVVEISNYIDHLREDVDTLDMQDAHT